MTNSKGFSTRTNKTNRDEMVDTILIFNDNKVNTMILDRKYSKSDIKNDFPTVRTASSNSTKELSERRPNGLRTATLTATYMSSNGQQVYALIVGKMPNRSKVRNLTTSVGDLSCLCIYDALVLEFQHKEELEIELALMKDTIPNVKFLAYA